MNSILEKIHFEWWQALLLLIALRMYPVFKAVATILVGRFVRPDLAKIALPLILASESSSGKRARTKKASNGCRTS
jgi:hypothetical protein